MSRPEAAGRSEMIRAIFALWLAATHTMAGLAQTGLADESAEPMPLVEASLLLDADSHGSRIISDRPAASGRLMSTLARRLPR